MKNRENVYCICAAIVSVISECGVILISIKMGEAIDWATDGYIEGLLGSCAFLLVLTILNNLLFLLSVWLNQCFIKHKTVKLRMETIKGLFRKPLYSFRRKEDAYYTNMLLSDVDNLGNRDFGMIVVEIKFISLFVGAIFAMIRISQSLFLISLGFSLLPLFVTWYFEKKISKRAEKCSDQNEKLQSEIIQFINSFEMHKINCVNQESLEKNIQSVAEKKGDKDVDKEVLQCASYMSIDTINSFGQLLLIGIGGYFIIHGRISTGQLISCIMLTQYVCSGINNYLETHVGRKAMKLIRGKVEHECAEIDQENPVWNVEQFKGNIDYCNVSFGYEACNEKVIHNISYKFEAGKTYAILGRSGCGKSTLMRLLMRYENSYTGQILIDGIDLRCITDEQLYYIIGLLNQNESILNASIKENITLSFDDKLDQERYKEVIQMLSLGALVNLVQDRKLGDFGETISGGERQRVALARVLYRKPKILILDEPLTGLDPENEQIVVDTFFSLEGVTRIMITHEYNDAFLNRFDYVIQYDKLISI